MIASRLSSAGMRRAMVSGRRMHVQKAVSLRQLCRTSSFSAHDTFSRRHNGPTSDADVGRMLNTIGVSSMESLIDQTVPTDIKYAEPPASSPALGETECLAKLKAMMSKNEIFRSHIGCGYYDTIVPPVILRNILENPGWYTPYTPYQAEISQGRLEMLLNYQTMVMDLTGMGISNASLLDEATAAAEGMTMVVKKGRTTFLVSDDVHPQTIAVVKTRAEAVGIKVQVMHHSQFSEAYTKDVFGVLIQYPNTFGSVEDYQALTAEAHSHGAKVVVGSDLLALTQLTPPGEWGADVVYGNAQRFGVPLGFGGPHAAFFATTDSFKRKLPGRVIGVSRDSAGKPALRMAMQTREQHIRRDMATSNICTAQALLANCSAAYAIYHGPEGLQTISKKVMAAAKAFAVGVEQCGLTVASKSFFDTVHVVAPGQGQALIDACAERRINIRPLTADSVAVSFDETVVAEDINELVGCFAAVTGSEVSSFDAEAAAELASFPLEEKFVRTSEFLTHPIFNSNHCETDMLRYLYSLQMKDLSLATAMIPLGSCTMKLNATSEMIPVTWDVVGRMHPFAPESQTKGYTEMIESLRVDLSKITGFHTVSLQPNAGSQGEYAGLLAIRGYHQSRNEAYRNVCLIPVSAHGTNPASAVMAGMKIVVIGCDSKGNIDWDDLVAKTEKHKDHLSALMVTYPSTHGVFESNIKDVCKLMHDNGGLVYMDGANMNAQVGLCSPGDIGADVCHLNLHKTFCIPHGGGGPGMGPIGVVERLAPFLPDHPLVKTGGEKSVGTIASAPFSSASILPISWMYLNMMGPDGLKNATQTSILNANYMAKRLKGHYDILYTGENGFCAHEFIIDLRPLKESSGITEEDVAKRLMDFNFHAPTMSWPVVGTLMVEPTESEPLSELDRFCEAMIMIRKEVEAVETGIMDRTNNPLKNAPHTADVVTSDVWDYPYTREQAAYPLPYLRTNKFWPSVGRLDNVYGDRNVVCSCPPLDAYEQA